ncbi:hypothetical protein SBOR_0798 [Sclerotinia borealis F-4128]|uniref:NAD(P)-binding domain-containing protein n=1 Tax=Sclerotinia borealis (strain F-4128) TaxID=1432307 RepID=W9CW40_SCLBF|nr:hypothetical protein SBOR_0798 [Sclerotinia borealis F-4128]
MRVLLLGATGNLGRRCIPALLAHKHSSRLIFESLNAVVEGDATDQLGIQNALLEHDVEGIINVAGTQVKRGEEWQLHKIARAVCDALRPLGVWICCGMGVLEYPGTGYLIEDYMPKRLSEQHRATCDVVESMPSSKVQWSLLCVAFMVPADAKQQCVELLDAPQHHNLLLSAGAPPAFDNTWLAYILWVELWIDFWFSVLWSYSTKYEDVADFLAEDLEYGHEQWVGKKVGMKDRKKLKSA